MRFGHHLAAVAASLMAVSPAVANPAAGLSLAQAAQTETPAVDEDEGTGPTTRNIIAIVAAVGIIAGFAVVVSEDDDSPDSP